MKIFMEQDQKKNLYLENVEGLTIEKKKWISPKLTLIGMDGILSGGGCTNEESDQKTRCS